MPGMSTGAVRFGEVIISPDGVCLGLTCQRGRRKYSRNALPSSRMISTDDNWKHLATDGGYTLFHRIKGKVALSLFSPVHGIQQHSIGITERGYQPDKSLRQFCRK